MKVKDITYFIESFAPLKTAYDWDNPGMQIGERSAELKGIYLCVDISLEAVKEAKKNGCNLIISHHPMFFSGIKRILKNEYSGKLIEEIIKNDINIYSAHTNMDVANEGLSVYMANKLNLKNISAIEDLTPLSFGLGVIGETQKEYKKEEIINKIKEVYSVSHIKTTGETKNKINKIALCTGAGSDLISKVKILGADLYITSDTKYHEFQKAKELSLILIDLDHFDSEKCFIDLIYDKLTQKFPNEKIIKSNIKNITEFL